MARSANITVTASKKATRLIIDAPSPPVGNVPFTVHVSGQLVDAGGYGVGGKVVSVYANGTLIGSPWTNANPLVGWLGIWWMDWQVKAAGTYTIHAEFGGDAEWEGCEETNDVVSGLGAEPPPTPPTPPPTPPVEIGGGALILGLLLLGGLALARRRPERG